MKYHTTKTGDRIALCDLETDHLKNIIKLMVRKSSDGLIIRSGGGGPDCSDMWYDEETLFGKAALDNMGYEHYVKEYESRAEEDK